MKETTAYRSEYLVAKCPYCGNARYIDIADDMAEGNIPENGRKILCLKCKKTFLLIPDW